MPGQQIGDGREHATEDDLSDEDGIEPVATERQGETQEGRVSHGPVVVVEGRAVGPEARASLLFGNTQVHARIGAPERTRQQGNLREDAHRDDAGHCHGLGPPTAGLAGLRGVRVLHAVSSRSLRGHHR